jgi:hypothetical protein
VQETGVYKENQDNMGLVPYNFDPEYLVEEINNRQHLIAKTTAKQYPLSV